jgi:hypothetical protein
MDHHSNPSILVNKIAEAFQVLTSVRAVALGGSSFGKNDSKSDIDIYVITKSDIPLRTREAIAKDTCAENINLDLHYWDRGDQWIDGTTGIEVDIIYWDPSWMEDQVNKSFTQNIPSLGYSTCTCHTIKNFSILYDSNGWLRELINFCRQPYPEDLRNNIIHYNYPVLRDVIPAYLHHIEKAVHRGDLISINHRVAALLASYFDIIFAFNRVTHPGEKRLIQLTIESCPHIPKSMKSQVETVLRNAANPTPSLIDQIDQLIDNLDDLLKEDGFRS